MRLSTASSFTCIASTYQSEHFVDEAVHEQTAVSNGESKCTANDRALQIKVNQHSPRSYCHGNKYSTIRGDTSMEATT